MRDLTTADIGDGILHQAGVADRILAGVEGDHGGESAGDGPGRDHGDVQGTHPCGLLRGQDHVAVVGQDHDLLSAEGLDGVKQLGGAGVHGLAAVDDGVASQIAEELLVAGTGDHGHHHAAPLADLRRRRGGHRQPLVAFTRLGVHVVDLHVADRPVPHGLAEDDTGVVDVHVDLDGALVSDDESAVPERREEGLERLAVDGRPGEQQARAVAVLGELAGLFDDHTSLRRHRRGHGSDGGTSGQAGAGGDPPAADKVVDARGKPPEEHEKAIAAGVHDPGLLQGRQLRGRVLDRDPAGLLDGSQQVLESEAVRHRLCRRRHLADDREHGAFDGLLDRPVGGVLSLHHRLLEHGRVERVGLPPHVADATDDLGQDDARVATRAHERPLGDRGGHRRDVGHIALLEFFHHGAHGERHVGPRVAVRDRVDVEVVDELALSLDGGECGLDDADGGGPDDQSWRSSTRTLICPTGMPLTRSSW